MKRGFAGVGLFKPKDAGNVGSVLRAAHCYGAGFVAIEGARNKSIREGANTTATQRHTPVYTKGDLYSHIPFDTQIVVVDLIPSATNLVEFIHPDRAFYIFGPEDGTLGRRHTDKAQHVVYIPTNACMNLAATVNVVLYDRMCKRGEF